MNAYEIGVQLALADVGLLKTAGASAAYAGRGPGLAGAMLGAAGSAITDGNRAKTMQWLATGGAAGTGLSIGAALTETAKNPWIRVLGALLGGAAGAGLVQAVAHSAE